MPVTGTAGNITGCDSNQRRIWFVANLYWQLLTMSVKFSHIKPEQFSCLAFWIMDREIISWWQVVKRLPSIPSMWEEHIRILKFYKDSSTRKCGRSAPSIEWGTFHPCGEWGVSGVWSSALNWLKGRNKYFWCLVMTWKKSSWIFAHSILSLCSVLTFTTLSLEEPQGKNSYILVESV